MDTGSSCQALAPQEPPGENQGTIAEVADVLQAELEDQMADFVRPGKHILQHSYHMVQVCRETDLATQPRTASRTLEVVFELGDDICDTPSELFSL